MKDIGYGILGSKWTWKIQVYNDNKILSVIIIYCDVKLSFVLQHKYLIEMFIILFNILFKDNLLFHCFHAII